jgi:hypothetical protein
MKERAYFVQKGKRRFTSGPFDVPRIRRNLRTVEWEVLFSPACRYALPGADQDDWNKGGGVSFDLFTNHTDSVMWSWRYNPVTDLIELGMYCHVDGKRVIVKAHSSEVIQAVKIGDTVLIRLTIGRTVKSYSMDFNTSTNAAGAMVPYSHDKKTARTIGAWFGGNHSAPHTMNIYILRKLTS